VFYLQSACALWLTGRSGSIGAVIAENRKLIKHHLSYTIVNPNSSHWYTWFLPWRPIFLRRDFDAVTGSIRVLITLGNPLLWWASTVAVVAVAVVVVRAGWRKLWPQLLDGPLPPGDAGGPDPSAALKPLGERAGLLLWILMIWAAPVAFWVPSLRDAYLYHYLPAYAFALVLLAGLIDRLYARRPLAALIGLALVLDVSLFYAPLWGEIPIMESALNARLFFPFWR
jgi:dolichyl-phosphate-mannose-protein mannosyltransferase